MPSKQADVQLTYSQILASLRRKREQIEEAILTVERLAREEGSHRGRTPAWVTKLGGLPGNTAPRKRAGNRGTRKNAGKATSARKSAQRS